MEESYKDYLAHLNNNTPNWHCSGSDLHAPHIAVIDGNRLERAFLRNFIRAYFNEIPVRTYKDGYHFSAVLAAASRSSDFDGECIRAVFVDPGEDEARMIQTFSAIKPIKALEPIPVFIMARKPLQDMARSLFDRIIGVEFRHEDRFITKPFDKMQLSMAIQKGSITPIPQGDDAVAA